MRKLLVVALLLAVVSIGYAKNPYVGVAPRPDAKLGRARMAHDHWNDRTSYFWGEIHYDWTDHGLGSFGLTQFFHYNRKHSYVRSWCETMVVGGLWEVKDAYVPFEKYGMLGGDGFSFKDWIRDAVGATTAIAWDCAMTKRHSALKNAAVGVSPNGVSLAFSF